MMNAFATYLPHRRQDREDLWKQMLTAIATHLVGNRPDRIEPRKLKKRDSKYTYMTRPRNEERRLLGVVSQGRLQNAIRLFRERRADRRMDHLRQGVRGLQGHDDEAEEEVIWAASRDGSISTRRSSQWHYRRAVA